MKNQSSLRLIKNEIIELRNENRRIVVKLDTQNSTIIGLSEELKTIRKEMCIYAKQKQHIDSILETLQSSGKYNQMINNINLIDNSNSNDSRNTMTNNENDFENILENYTILQNPIIKTEIPDEIEDNSTCNENDDNSYYNDNLINRPDTMIKDENVLNDRANSSLSNEITIKKEPENPCIYESLENGWNNQEKNLIEEENCLNPDNESASHSSIQSSKPQSSNLVTQTNVDSDKGQFKCNLCAKTFTKSCNLKMHLRVHTGTTPFRCDLCSRTFKHACSLKSHLRTHTGEKPFKCGECKKAFTHSSYLKSHLKLHTDEK